MARSIVTPEGNFRSDVTPEVAEAFRLLCNDMIADDGGEDASWECLTFAARTALEEQGVHPIPDDLPSRLAVAGRMVVTFGEYPSPFRNI